jgi:Uncharacterized protein encoded in hypervariable junctions of pilus gene clusters
MPLWSSPVVSSAPIRLGGVRVLLVPQVHPKALVSKGFPPMTVTALNSVDSSDRLTVYVPPALKRAIRIAAAYDGVTMTKWVTRALNDAMPTFDMHAPDGTRQHRPSEPNPLGKVTR